MCACLHREHFSSIMKANLHVPIHSFFSSSNLWIFIYAVSSYGYITNPHNDQLLVGLIAQLVEHYNGIAEVMDSNPVQAWNFLQLNLSCAYNCDDHSLYSDSYTCPIWQRKWAIGQKSHRFIKSVVVLQIVSSGRFNTPSYNRIEISRQTVIGPNQGPVLQKAINASQWLKVNRSRFFSWLNRRKILAVIYVKCFQLKSISS